MPASNTNLEPDVIRLLPDDTWAYFQRVGDYGIDSIPDLEQMRELAMFGLEGRVRELAAADVDVYAYGCTSASFAMGSQFDRELRDRVSSWSGKPAVSAAAALVEALQALGARRIALGTPYEASVHKVAIEFLEAEGLRVVGEACPERTLTNREQGALGPEQVIELARLAMSDDAEALALSCTDMRSLEVVEMLERELARPVVTSNQALVWATLNRLDGVAGMRRCGALTAAGVASGSAR